MWLTGRWSDSTRGHELVHLFALFHSVHAGLCLLLQLRIVESYTKGKGPSPLGPSPFFLPFVFNLESSFYSSEVVLLLLDKFLFFNVLSIVLGPRPARPESAAESYQATTG